MCLYHIKLYGNLIQIEEFIIFSMLAKGPIENCRDESLVMNLLSCYLKD